MASELAICALIFLSTLVFLSLKWITILHHHHLSLLNRDRKPSFQARGSEYSLQWLAGQLAW